MARLLDGQRVLITGGNSGIGLWTAVGLARQGAHVVITARDRHKGEAAVEEIRTLSGRSDVDWMLLDLASFESIRRMAGSFAKTYDRLDVFVQNAGLILTDRTLTEDGFETTFGVNHLGHFVLTDRLLPQLGDGPGRVVVVSSEAHRAARNGLDFDDLQSARRYRALDAYCKSKLANIYFARSLARRLAGTKITANALHPGVVASGFAGSGDTRGLFSWVVKLGRPFFLSAEQGAANSVFVASDLGIAQTSGAYFVRKKVRAPSRVAQDDAAAQRLWDRSEDMVREAAAAP